MADVYKIGVSLAMSSNHAAVLSALSSHLLGVHTQVNNLRQNFGRLGLAIGGAFSIAAGLKLVGVMEDIIDKTKEYNRELVALKNLGGETGAAAQSGYISKRAFEIAERTGIPVASAMAIPREMSSIMGFKEADAEWERMAKLGFVTSHQAGYKGDVNKDLQAMIKGASISGLDTDDQGHFSEARLNRLMDILAKASVATGGMVNPRTVYQLSQQAGGTLKNLTDEGLLTELMMAQNMGGFRAGTSFMSTFQQFTGASQMRRQTAEGLVAAGLAQPGEIKNLEGTGQVIMSDPLKKRLLGMTGKDPMDLAANLWKNFEAQGVTDPIERMQKVMAAFGRQTSQRATMEQVNNFQQMLQERGRIGQAGNLEQLFDRISKEDIGANIDKLSSAWNNLMVAIGGPNSENFIAALNKLTDTINYLKNSLQGMGNERIQQLGLGIAALATAFVGAGVVAMMAAIGPAGWLVLGIGALAAAFLAFKDNKILNDMDAFVNRLADWVRNGILKVFQAIQDAISSALGKFGNAFNMGKAAPEHPESGGGSIWDNVWGPHKATPQNYVVPEKDTGSMIQRSAWSPPQRTAQPVQVMTTLNLDGRALAEATSERMAEMYAIPGSAAAAGAGSGFMPGDSGFSAT